MLEASLLPFAFELVEPLSYNLGGHVTELVQQRGHGSAAQQETGVDGILVANPSIGAIW
jgi:hypothetical protein